MLEDRTVQSGKQYYPYGKSFLPTSPINVSEVVSRDVKSVILLQPYLGLWRGSKDLLRLTTQAYTGPVEFLTFFPPIHVNYELPCQMANCFGNFTLL